MGIIRLLKYELFSASVAVGVAATSLGVFGSTQVGLGVTTTTTSGIKPGVGQLGMEGSMDFERLSLLRAKVRELAAVATAAAVGGVIVPSGG